MRKQLKIGLVAVLAISAAVAVPMTATASVPGAEVSAADPAVLALVAERGIAVSRARQTIAAQVRAAELVDPLAASMGPAAFGGLWIGDDDRINVGVVGVVGEAAAAAPHRLASANGLDGWVDTVPVRHSLAALEAASDWLGAQVVRVNEGAESALMSALDVRENAVELRLPRQGRLTAAQYDLVAAATSRFGPMLQVTRYTGHAEANACRLTACDPPIRGGVRIHGNQACTLGFLARSRNTGRPYGITAGHCQGSSWAMQSEGRLRQIGNRSGRRFDEGGDMQSIHVLNDRYWKPRPWVFVARSADTTVDRQYRIRGDGRSVQGMRICATGSFSGTHCGRVTALDVSVTYTNHNNQVVRHMGEANFCTAPGDSGGPLYSGHIAFGLIGSDNCRNNQGFTFYQGIRAAEDFLQVDILTG